MKLVMITSEEYADYRVEGHFLVNDDVDVKKLKVDLKAFFEQEDAKQEAVREKNLPYNSKIESPIFATMKKHNVGMTEAIEVLNEFDKAYPPMTLLKAAEMMLADKGFQLIEATEIHF